MGTKNLQILDLDFFLQVSHPKKLPRQNSKNNFVVGHMTHPNIYIYIINIYNDNLYRILTDSELDSSICRHDVVTTSEAT